MKFNFNDLFTYLPYLVKGMLAIIIVIGIIILVTAGLNKIINVITAMDKISKDK